MKKAYTLLTVALAFVSISNAQTINTVGGNGIIGFSGDGGAATDAELDSPCGVAVDNIGNIFIGDWSNSRVRKINTAGTISTIAGNGVASYSGDGGPATAAEIYKDVSVTVDDKDNVYIADQFNNRVRKVNTSGIITTVAGNGVGSFNGDGGPATAAEIYSPTDLKVDKAGNIFIADVLNQRVRKVNTSGIISTIAGNGLVGFSGDGSAATTAELNWPYGIAIDSSDNVYIGDYKGARIRMVNTSGIITTVAGNGVGSYSGDGGPATASEVNYPYGFIVDPSQKLYFSDSYNNVIRVINTSGVISTVAGVYPGGNFSGDGGPATDAELNYPLNLGLDKWNNLYIADELNQRVRKVGNNTEEGITIITNTVDLNIYPNPSTGQFTLEAKNQNLKLKTIEVFNVLGQKVLNEMPETEQSTYKINIASQPDGVYLYRVIAASGEIIGEGKIILEH